MMITHHRLRSAFVRVLALLAAGLMLAPTSGADGAQPVAQALTPSCPGSQVPGQYDFHGLTLVSCNFSGADLSHANFKGATLTAVVFVRAKLVGADFSGATFVDSGNPVYPNDFTLADLHQAKFIGAQFNGLTYFSYANLSFAVFSGSGLSLENAVFGETIVYDPVAYSGPSFAGRIMTCEFVPQWAPLDLTGANISSCGGQLANRDLAGARMSNVDFSSMVLDGTSFVGAQLTKAVFTSASLQCTGPVDKPQCVDFSAAQLQGASFDNANLTGASLYGAFLSNGPGNGELNAASIKYAHLKNVNLAFAQLSGVNFSYANFYGGEPSNPQPCTTTGANNAGFTNNCATAHAATMVGTSFSGAYLYGIDLTSAAIAGADFSGAVLVGANFAGSTIGVNSFDGTPTSFVGAFLQGTNLDQTQTLAADLTKAFMDFERGGNLMNILLIGGSHNLFPCTGAACKPASGANVCVLVRYGRPTTVTAGNPSLTCPDGNSSGSTGCGAGQARSDPGGVNPRWQSSVNINTSPVPPQAWYRKPASYTDKTAVDDPTLCGGPANPQIVNW